MIREISKVVAGASGSKPKMKTWWQIDCMQPRYVESNLKMLEGARYARRPSYVDKHAQKRSSEVLFRMSTWAIAINGRPLSPCHLSSTWMM